MGGRKNTYPASIRIYPPSILTVVSGEVVRRNSVIRIGLTVNRQLVFFGGGGGGRG